MQTIESELCRLLNERFVLLAIVDGTVVRALDDEFVDLEEAFNASERALEAYPDAETFIIEPM